MIEPTSSLLPRLPDGVPAVLTFAVAARAVAMGSQSWGSQLLSTLDDARLRAHFYAVADEWGIRDSSSEGHFSDGAVPKAERQVDRMPDGLEERGVFRRDDWHCRWCGTPVLDRRSVKHMARTLPDVFGYARTNDRCHGLVLACTASLDHVVPHSKGGQNEERNLVTACWPCQFGRGEDSIERIGLFDPAERSDPAVLPGWDGCEWFG